MSTPKIQLVCGPTCGCGKVFEVESGREAKCPHCGLTWGTMYFSETIAASEQPSDPYKLADEIIAAVDCIGTNADWHTVRRTIVAVITAAQKHSGVPNQSTQEKSK